MTKKFGLSALLGAGAVALSTTAAVAQSAGPPTGPPGGSSAGYPTTGSAAPSGYPGGSGAPGGAPGGAATAGSIDTSQTSATTYSESEETIGGDAQSSLPDTGGEPLVISMLGSLIAGSALVLRRKFN